MRLATLHPAAAPLLALGLALGGSACGAGERPAAPSTGASEQARLRAVALTPVDLVEARREKVEARQVYDAEGKLLPGEVVVAGIRMPKGLEQTLEVENRYYFEGEQPLEKVRAYLGPRLHTMQVVPAGSRAFKFVKATTKDGDKPHTVDVRIGPKPGSPRVAQVFIEDYTTRPPPTIQSFERTEAQLEAIRKFAE